MTLAAIVEAICAQADRRPDAVALREPTGRALTYAELRRDVTSVAAALAQEGLQPGDGVLFAVRPSVPAIVLILALLRQGAMLVGLEPGTGDDLFQTQVGLLQPRWVVAESAILAASAWGPVRGWLRRRGTGIPPLARLPECTFVHVGPAYPGVPGGPSYARLREIEAPVAPAAVDAEAPAFVVFTSGTTAAPKAVIHTQRSLRLTVELLAGQAALMPTDVVYSKDLHGLVPALLAGASALVAGPGSRPPAQVLADYHQAGVTHVFGTPAELQAVLDVLDASGARGAQTHAALPGTLRAILLGSAPVERRFLQRLQTALPAAATVWSVYALTELLPVACASLMDKLAYEGPGDFVGTPVPGVTMRIAETGELLLRGPHLCRGYLGEAPLEELATGDLAEIDPRGRLILRGRVKDMIIRGADNLYPGLYESRIASIAGVQRCSLVGIYDPARADERLVLAVEPRPHEDLARLKQRLRQALRSGPASIDSRAQPDEIVFCAIPLHGRSQKVDRQALRDHLQGQLARC